MPETICLERRKTAPLIIGTLFVVFAVIRLFFPVIMNDSMGFYSSTSLAVIEHQNWGKQVLAGVIEYSPLPAGLMIIIAPIGKLPFLNINSATVVIAISQAAVFCSLFMILGEFVRQRWVRLGLSVAAMLCIGLGRGSWIPGQYLLQADPFWITLVPLCLLILFAARVGRVASLRPVLGYSLACGVLLFCGPAGIVLASVSLVVLVVFARKELELEGGTTLLALMPFIYGLILHAVFNLVIMGDSLFSIKRLIPYFQASGPPLFASWRSVLIILWGVFVIGGLIVLKRVPFFVRASWALAVGCAPVFVLRRCGALFIGGEYLISGLVSVGLIISLCYLMVKQGISLKVAPFAIVCTVILLASVLVLRRYALINEPYLNDAHPSREQVTAFIDQDWVGSRVLVFGARTSSLYCLTESDDPKIRDRFIGNIDFNTYVVQEHMEREQLHLLVPPDTGQYYPRGDTFFSRLYRNEEPEWLHLEAVMDGWQLWRCVRKLPQKGSM